MNFYLNKLSASIARAGSNLCVGLDPDTSRFPQPYRQIADKAEATARFCRDVVEATRDFACAFKPNLAFFEALGAPAFSVLEEVVRCIGPEIPVIADAKRGDIGNTAAQYRKAFFDVLQVDAITVNPWMGIETISPYLDAPGKAVYVLVLTSNPGATDFMLHYDDGKTLSLQLAESLEMLQEKASCHVGMVLGATRPALLTDILSAHPHGSALVPGFGAQGGNPDLMRPLFENHLAPPVLNVSRDILFPGGPDDSWKDRVGAAARNWSKTLDFRQHAS